MSIRVCVIGLGKLGSPLAACLAAKGLTVMGVDNDPRKIDAINQGKAPVNEPGLAEMIGQAQGRLTATSDIEQAVAQTDITFIVVSTPSDPAGGFSGKRDLCRLRLAGAAARPGARAASRLLVHH